MPPPSPPVGPCHIGFDPGLAVSQDDRIVRDCQVWIANNYSETKPVSKMAQMSGLLRATFARRFKSATGYHPMEYVHALTPRRSCCAAYTPWRRPAESALPGAPACRARAPNNTPLHTPPFRSGMVAAEKIDQYSCATQHPPNHCLAGRISTLCTWKTFFARSKPIVLTSLMDGSRPLVSLTTQLWHIDAVRGPSTPQNRLSGAMLRSSGEASEAGHLETGGQCRRSARSRHVTLG